MWYLEDEMEEDDEGGDPMDIAEIAMEEAPMEELSVSEFIMLQARLGYDQVSWRHRRKSGRLH